MNGFVIYSMGDPEFIRLAILGLSHAFEQGAVSLAKIGLMIGLIMVFWKAIWEPGKIEFKQFFIGFFLVFLLFVKQVNVTLVHSDGSADAMPPIPIGIALAGTIATNFGHSMATSLREFYHTSYIPGDVQTGSYSAMIGVEGADGSRTPPVAGNGLEPLRELMKMRFSGSIDTLTSSRARAAAGINPDPTSMTTDLSGSLENYIHDCVLKDQYQHNNTQEVNEEAMKIAPWAWPHMEVSYDGWSTSVNLSSGHGWQTVTCPEAYRTISSKLTEDGKYVTENVGAVKGSADEVLVNSAVSMLGSVNTEAWHIKMNQILRYHYKKTKTQSRWASEAELMASQAEFEAMDQRRVSSAVQFSLWSEMAIPLITFFESFVYLIGPIMPLVIAFGEKGAGMVSKYFFLIIWVNTWPVLQVGVNMYLQNYINKASFSQAPYDAFSWAGFNTSFTEVESFIAMGSTLQTMVPALSLMLLYGTSQAAVNLSQSASKSGGSEGSMATPKGAAANDSGKMTIGNHNSSYDQNAKASLQGYSNTSSVANGMQSHTVGSTLQAASSAIQASAKEDMHTASQTISNSTSKMLSQMQGGTEQGGTAITASAGSSEGVSRAAGYASQIQKAYGTSDEDSKTLGLALAGGFGAKAQAQAAVAVGLDAGKVAAANGAIKVDASLDAGVKAKVDSALKTASSISEQASGTDSYQKMKQGQATLQNAMTKTDSSSTSKSDMFGTTGQKMEQAGESWVSAEKISTSESATQQAVRAIASNSSFNNSPVTSTASSNKIDEGFADGSLLTNAAVNSGYDSLRANGLTQKFNDFKANQAANGNAYANTKDGTALAMRDFSQTKAGAGLEGNFKTSSENSADYMNFLKEDTKGDMTRESVSASNGRYADKVLGDIVKSSGSNRYEAGADFLDEMNNRSGGNQAGWSTASRELRDIGQKVQADSNNIENNKSPLIKPVASDPKAAPKSSDQIQKQNKALEKSVNGSVADTKKKIDGANIADTHNSNVNKLNENSDYNKTPEAIRRENQIKTDAKNNTAGAKALKENTQPLTDTMNRLNKEMGPAVKGVADLINGGLDLVNGTPGEQLAGAMSKDTGIKEENAQLITSGNNHAKIAGIVGKGTSSDASREDKQNLVEMMAAAKQAQPIIDQLNSSGKPEDKALAKEMQQNINSANIAMEKSGFSEGNASFAEIQADNIASKQLSPKAAAGGLETMLNEDYSANLKPGNKLSQISQLLADQKGGQEMLSNLSPMAPNYQTLKDNLSKIEKTLDQNPGMVSTALATDGLGLDDSSKKFIEGVITGKIDPSATQGSELHGNVMSYSTSLNARENILNDEGEFAKLATGEERNNEHKLNNYMADREGYVKAAEQLANIPGQEEAGQRALSFIAEKDKQLGLDVRQGDDYKNPAAVGDNAQQTNSQQVTPTNGQQVTPTNGQQVTSTNGQQVTPTNGQQVTPTNGQQVTPTNGQQVTPTNGQQVTSTNSQQVTPTNGQQVTPTNGQQVTPTNGQQVTSTNSQQVTPTNGQQVTPTNGQQVTPTNGQQVTPTNSQQVTPTNGQQVTSTNGQQVTPTNGQQVTPTNGQQVTPTNGQQVTPTNGQQVTPTNGQQVTSTNSQQVTPTNGQQVTPTNGQQVTPTNGQQVTSTNSQQVTPTNGQQVTPTNGQQVTPTNGQQVTSTNGIGATTNGQQVTTANSDQDKATANGEQQVSDNGRNNGAESQTNGKEKENVNAESISMNSSSGSSPQNVAGVTTGGQQVTPTNGQQVTSANSDQDKATANGEQQVSDNGRNNGAESQTNGKEKENVNAESISMNSSAGSSPQNEAGVTTGGQQVTPTNDQQVTSANSDQDKATANGEQQVSDNGRNNGAESLSMNSSAGSSPQNGANKNPNRDEDKEQPETNGDGLNIDQNSSETTTKVSTNSESANPSENVNLATSDTVSSSIAIANYTPSIDESNPSGSVEQMDAKQSEINSALVQMIEQGQGGSQEYNALREKAEEIGSFMFDNSEKIQQIRGT